MNAITSVEKAPERKDAETALETLRAWASTATAQEMADLDPALSRLLSDTPDYPVFRRDYPEDFAVGEVYKSTLPDLQNGPSSLIRGHVSKSNMWASPISGCRSVFAPATMAN